MPGHAARHGIFSGQRGDSFFFSQFFFQWYSTQNPVNIILCRLVFNHCIPDHFKVFIGFFFLCQEKSVFFGKLGNFGDGFSLSLLSAWGKNLMSLSSRAYRWLSWFAFSSFSFVTWLSKSICCAS